MRIYRAFVVSLGSLIVVSNLHTGNANVQTVELAADSTVAQSQCIRIDECAFGPSQVFYAPERIDLVEVPQCSGPPAPPIPTAATSDRNRVHLTWTHDNNVYAFNSILWNDIATELATNKFNPETFLTTRSLAPPGLYYLEADYYMCVDESQKYLPAPLQCEAQLCVNFADTYRPKSTKSCPILPKLTSPPAIIKPDYVDKNEKIFPMIAFVDYVQSVYADAILDFIAWYTSVSNFPCIDGVLGTRCDVLEVVRKKFGEDPKPVIGSRNQLEAAVAAILEYMETITPPEWETLSTFGKNKDWCTPDLGLNPNFCTRCFDVFTSLKEIIKPATCETPTASPICEGDPTQTCELNKCVQYSPSDLFTANIDIDPACKENTAKIIKSRNLKDEKADIVFASDDEKFKIALGSIIEIVSANKINEVDKAKYVYFRFQLVVPQAPWNELLPTTSLTATLRENKVVRITVLFQAWTPCGKLFEKTITIAVYCTRRSRRSSYSRELIDEGDVDPEELLEDNNNFEDPVLIEQEPISQLSNTTPTTMILATAAMTLVVLFAVIQRKNAIESEELIESYHLMDSSSHK